MDISEYVTQDSVGLAALVSTGAVSPAELADTARSAARLVNAELNAFVEIWDDEPLADNGPFKGVPFAVKEIGLTVKDRRLEFASRLAAGTVMPEDSDLMRRFRKAGFTAIGRTTMPEFAMSTTTEPVFGGPTLNPWDKTRSAGGSSGGAAVAVAAGVVPVAHATDAGGSIRIPASCTGVVGLKPSRGRVSMGPALDEVWGGLASQFVLSRSVRDSAALLDCLEGPNVGEPFELARPATPYAELIQRSPRKLRIGYMVHPLNGKRSAASIVSAAEQTARTLDTLGHEVEPVTLDPGISWEAYALATGRYWTAYNASFIQWLSGLTGRPVDESTVEPASLAVYRQGLETKAVDLIEAGSVRNMITRSIGTFFERFDILLTPTLPDLPLPIGALHDGAEHLDGVGWVRRVLDHAPFSGLFNMSGTPAISLPLNQDPHSGLPIGMQFAARFGAEDILLQLAAQLEAAAPWSGRKPPYSADLL
ncbi:amidase [Pseudochelatococcus sp. B33]